MKTIEYIGLNMDEFGDATAADSLYILSKSLENLKKNILLFWDVVYVEIKENIHSNIYFFR